MKHWRRRRSLECETSCPGKGLHSFDGSLSSVVLKGILWTCLLKRSPHLKGNKEMACSRTRFEWLCPANTDLSCPQTHCSHVGAVSWSFYIKKTKKYINQDTLLIHWWNTKGRVLPDDTFSFWIGGSHQAVKWIESKMVLALLLLFSYIRQRMLLPRRVKHQDPQHSAAPPPSSFDQTAFAGTVLSRTLPWQYLLGLFLTIASRASASSGNGRGSTTLYLIIVAVLF